MAACQSCKLIGAGGEGPEGWEGNQVSTAPEEISRSWREKILLILMQCHQEPFLGAFWSTLRIGPFSAIPPNDRDKDSQSIDKSLMCFLQRTWDHCSHLGRLHAFDTCYDEGKIALLLSEVMVTERLGPASLRCVLSGNVWSLFRKPSVFGGQGPTVLLMDLKFHIIPYWFPLLWMQGQGTRAFLLSVCSGRVMPGGLSGTLWCALQLSGSRGKAYVI